MTDAPQPDGLRICVADEDEKTLAQTERLLSGLGHTVSAYATAISQAGDIIVREDPDLSVVVVNDDEHALDLIEEIGEYARGPIIALISDCGPGFVSRAIERGIYAYARPQFRDEVQGAIELALRRHQESARLTEQVGQLEGALQRRGTIERAKGILMERHSLDDRGAFELLRRQARGSNRRVVDLAHAVANGHALLPRSGD